MHKKSDIGPRNQHTIVLQPRRVDASHQHNIGLQQRYFGSVPQTRASPQDGIRRLSVMVPIPPSQTKRPQILHTRMPEGDLLTRFGVDSMPGRMVARILIALVLFQPVYIALGMELEEQPEEVVEAQAEPNTLNGSDVSAQEDSVVVSQDEAEEGVGSDGESDGDIAVETTTSDEVSDSSDVQTEEDEVAVHEEQSDSTEGEENDVPQNQEEGGTEESQETDESETGENDDTSKEESNVSGSDGTQEGLDGGTTTDDVSDNETTPEEGDDENTSGEESDDGGIEDEEGISEEEEDTASTTDESRVASTTDETDVEEPLETTINNTSNKYIFGEGDCTLVTEGEFYCIEEGPTRERLSGDTQVYAEKDREGDKEIYYFDGVEVTRITNNSYDDFAPVFDEETRRIVWHAMINDRLQIMLHELPTNTTRQITTSRENSSTPSIVGDTVVWQEWVETNWEIMMTDVDNDGQPFEIERLTDNAVHDMFPMAYDDLITWQSERGGVWEVVVYDIRTGKKRSVEKTEDTKYENPRFVLLFDSKHENGDVETIGYDLDSGEMMELGTTSMPLPIEPVTPKEEAPEAVLREASSTTHVKMETDDEGGGDGGDEESEL